MKQNKFYPLLAVSALFLIVSFVLLCLLGYNFYKQQRGSGQKIAIAKPKNILATPVERTRDTLQQMYAATVSKLPQDSTIDSAFAKTDSAQHGLASNSIGDVNKLKSEISSLLKDSSTSIADLELARYKIKELQVRVDELKTRNTDVEKENKRLRALLEQMAISNSTFSPSGSARATESNERPVAEKSSSSLFSASDLKLAAADESDAETANADATEKFIGSMVVRNSLVQGMGEVMLVLIQPDGKVIRNAWESGSFDTDKGKKIYSRKITFDYNKGESRRINFSVPADNIQKGTYTLQVYNNGKVIARTTKSIS